MYQFVIKLFLCGEWICFGYHNNIESAKNSMKILLETFDDLMIVEINTDLIIEYTDLHKFNWQKEGF